MISPAVVLGEMAPLTADPARVERMIEAATATLGHELGRYLGPPAETVESHHGGRPFVQLFDDPVADENADFTVEHRTGTTEPWAAVEIEDYAVDGRNVRHGHCWPRGLSCLRVTYTRGYEEDEGPAELRDLVLQMVKARLQPQENTNMQSESIGDYSYTRKDLTAMDDWPMIAARWRRTRV